MSGLALVRVTKAFVSKAVFVNDGAICEANYSDDEPGLVTLHVHAPGGFMLIHMPVEHVEAVKP